MKRKEKPWEGETRFLLPDLGIAEIQALARGEVPLRIRESCEAMARFDRSETERVERAKAGEETYINLDLLTGRI